MKRKYELLDKKYIKIVYIKKKDLSPKARSIARKISFRMGCKMIQQFQKEFF